MQRHSPSSPSITDAVLSIPDRSHCPFLMEAQKNICFWGILVIFGVDYVWEYNVE